MKIKQLTAIIAMVMSVPFDSQHNITCVWSYAMLLTFELNCTICTGTCTNNILKSLWYLINISLCTNIDLILYVFGCSNPKNYDVIFKLIYDHNDHVFAWPWKLLTTDGWWNWAIMEQFMQKVNCVIFLHTYSHAERESLDSRFRSRSFAAWAALSNAAESNL